MLLNRRSEREALEQVLDLAGAGLSSVLVIRGDPGIGKSALLDFVSSRAARFRVERATGVESEMELAFAGLHQLCAPMLDRLDRLPAPQRGALRTAFGLEDGDVPDLFLVGLAVLSLFSEAADDGPLVCIVDDSQWLDRASLQALGFVGRRLQADSVALLFATREQSFELAGLPQLLLEGLPPADARRLLASTVAGRLDDRVSDQIVAETRGNPLALVELPRGLGVMELAGGFGLPGVLPLSGRIEESFQRRIGQLPATTRELLLLAAAEPVGDPALLRRAAAGLGFSAGALAAAEDDGLVAVGARVMFRHPLVRSAVYAMASADARREVHRALAEATDSDVDPDRRAWHRAQATAGPDEQVAAELDRSASSAQARGGLGAAAAFLERAAALTPERARRVDRLLAAAEVTNLAGAAEAALTLIAGAEADGPLDGRQRAQLDLLRAQTAFVVNRGSEAPALLLAAARQLERLDISLARETYLDAFAAAMFAGRLARDVGLPEVAQAARAAPPPLSQPPRPADRLLDGLAVLFTDGYAAGVPMVREALSAFRHDSLSGEPGRPWLWLACIAAADLWDDETWYALSTYQLRVFREAGALSELPIALSSQVYVHLHAGELAAATVLVEELKTVSEVTGSQLAPYGALGVAAWRGNAAEAETLVKASLKDAAFRGQGNGVTVAHWARALVYNGLGRYDEAALAAREASAFPDDLAASSQWGLMELIEAATRSGQKQLAADALLQFSETTSASGTDWALGVEARARALLADSDDAEPLYREAIERLGRTRVRAELARAHLLYGEWLRAEGRRVDAREQLRTALELFTKMGAEAFAQRAERELVATGGRAVGRAVETTGMLTGQEDQIARLARDRLSNPEIGARLFISPRTVEYHLHKVFTKLGIGSRAELQVALDDPTAQVAGSSTAP
jgi:DNA-binding CsgD family transcriptional regulator